MKICLSFFFVLLTALPNAFAQSTPALSATGQRVLDTEQHRFELMVKRDTVQLAAMLADDLVYMHSNGLVETKKQHIQAISTGRLLYNTMQREESSVRLYGKMALTNGIVHAAGIINGAAFDIRLRYTAVYLRKKGEWLLVNWQSTRI